MTEKKHVSVPKNTRAFIYADCGAVALDANNLCKVQGMGLKSDCCGIEGQDIQKTATTMFIENDGSVEIADKLLSIPSC